LSDFTPPPEVIIQRFRQHMNWAEEFIAHYPEISLRVNPKALFLAVKSAYDDIYRYKAYHLNDPQRQLSDSVKRAAYLCKWMNKFRPIEYSGEFDVDDGAALDDISAELLNGVFTLQTCRTHIADELSKDFSFEDIYFDEFQYDLLYRDIGSDGLLHIFQMIFSAVKVKRAGVLVF